MNYSGMKAPRLEKSILQDFAVGVFLSVGMTLVLAGCGGGGADSPITPPPAVTDTFVGQIRGGPGDVNGTGSEARFGGASGLAIDSVGNLCVADSANHVIRKVTPAGVVTTFAGNSRVNGSTDGTGAAARFFSPVGVAIDSTGNLFVTDSLNRTIRKITPSGVVSTLAGTAGIEGFADGMGAQAIFSLPEGVATDRVGNVYVADAGNDTIRKITTEGVVTTFVGAAGVSGSADGIGGAARLSRPSGVATDGAGNIYVADTNNQTIRKITPAGVVTTVAGAAGILGSNDGMGPEARFFSPGNVATDSAGNIYVVDYNNAIRKITPSGMVTTLAGTPGIAGSADGIGPAASFRDPRSLATDSAGNIYVGDAGNSTIRKISLGGTVTTLAGVAVFTGLDSGTQSAANFSEQGRVRTDGAGNVYVPNVYVANELTIVKISPAGVVTPFAGGAGGAGPIAIDKLGNVYVLDVYFSRSAGIGNGSATIRKIAPSGVVTTLAGTLGIAGSADGTGPAASFYFPRGLATDSAGNVYVADNGNHTVRKITPEGVVTTLAGTAGIAGTADGAGPAARFNILFDLAADSTGNVFVLDGRSISSTDYGATIRKITPTGVVTTLAGTQGVVGPADGAGAAASFSSPSSLATDSTGNIYVADTNNHLIRKITPSGVVSTVIGTPGLYGYVPGGMPGVLRSPGGVALHERTMYLTMGTGIARVANAP